MLRLPILILILFFSLNVNAQYYIKGKFDLNPLQYEVHLDVLENWDDFQSIGPDMIIKSTTIDSAGYYYFSGNELPERAAFYRIRFTKAGTTPVMINSSPRNYITFVFNNQDTITLDNFSIIPNNKANEKIMLLTTQLDGWHQEYFNANNAKHESLIVEKREKMMEKAIHSENAPMVQLFALGNGFETPQKYIHLFHQVKQNLEIDYISPSYSASIQDVISIVEYPSIKRSNQTLWAILWISLLCNLLVGIAYLRLLRSSQKSQKTSIDLAQLTVKERQIIALIQTSKTNKEIAQSLNVSEATIKTHINNIYRKLGVHSRKEVLQKT